jgi:hypothetical protein
MTLRNSLLKSTALFTALFYLSGMVIFPLIPKAHALYWEDASDEANNPKETKTRPTDFMLFNWVGDLNKDAKKTEYQNMDNHDRGPSVNNDARTLVIVASGIVGLGIGLFVSNRLSSDATVQTSDMFIGGALGLGAGILIGALIMPGDYNVDQRAQSEFLKQRQAWLQDPLRLQVAQAFHPSSTAFSLRF